jgi:hypothetical protein
MERWNGCERRPRDSGKRWTTIRYDEAICGRKIRSDNLSPRLRRMVTHKHDDADRRPLIPAPRC